MIVNVRPAVLIALGGTLAAFLATASASAADCPVLTFTPQPWQPQIIEPFSVPPDCHLMLVKIWGNGGNAGVGDGAGYGGGGAALTAVYEVQEGQRFGAKVRVNWGPNPGYSGHASVFYSLPPTSAVPTELLIAAGGGGGGHQGLPTAARPHGGAGGGEAGEAGLGTTNAGIQLGGGTGGTQNEGGEGGAGWPKGLGNGLGDGHPGGPFPCAPYAPQPPYCGYSGAGGKGGQGGYSGGAGGMNLSNWSVSGGGGGGSSRVVPDPRLVYSRQFGGSRQTPGNALDPHRNGAGEGAIVYPADNQGGRVVVMFNALDIDSAKTTRWKPMRSDDPIDIEFESPIELASATLEIEDPNGVAVSVNPPPTLEQLATTPAYRYKLRWNGPWAVGTQRLPAGNYKVIVHGTPVGGTWEMASAPYDRISFVEVKEINLEPLEGGAFEDNPNGGLRIFAEAKYPADVNPNAEILNRVKVTATIKPEMPDAATLEAPIRVSFKSLDVDDPAGAPIDTTHPIDNRGTPPEGSWMGLGGPTGVVVVDGKASATLTVSMRQGDNYRVAASTASGWLGGLDPIGGVVDGSVWHATEGLVPEGPNLSKMLTVWRTFHVELDRMETALTQARFQINGSWTSIELPRKLVDTTNPFFSFKTIENVEDHKLREGWKGARLNPRIAGTDDFEVETNDVKSVSIAPPGTLAPPVTDPANRAYYLRDDVLDSLLTANHDLSVVTSVLEEVYIRVDAIPLPPPMRPLVQNMDPNVVNTSHPRHTNSPSYWTVPLILAFEGALGEDHDPTPPHPTEIMVTAGETSAGSLSPASFVYMETIRDYSATGVNCHTPTVPVAQFRTSTMAHELLHALTLDHRGDSNAVLMCSLLKNSASWSLAARTSIFPDHKRMLRELIQPRSPTVNCTGANCCPADPCGNNPLE
jgi:hypothetical protein